MSATTTVSDLKRVVTIEAARVGPMTEAELAALGQVGEANGTLLGLSAITARLLNEIALHARDTATHLAAIAGPFGGSANALVTEGSIDAPTVERFAGAVTKVVQTTIHPQFQAHDTALTELRGRVVAAEGALHALKEQHATLAVRMQEWRDDVGLRLEAEREAVRGRIHGMRDELVELSLAEYRETCRRIETDHQALATRFARMEEILHQRDQHETSDGDKPTAKHRTSPSR